MSDPLVLEKANPEYPWRAYLYEGMYTSIANLLCTDPFLLRLQQDKSFVFDFIPFPSIETVYKKPQLLTIPQDTPHIYLTLSNIQTQPMSSCNDKYTCTAVVAMNSQLRHAVPYQIVSYFPSQFDGRTFGFSINPENTVCAQLTGVSANTDFDASRQEIKTTITANITAYISSRK